MALRDRVVLIDDEDWLAFQGVCPDNPAAYATAALGVEGDRLRQEQERGRGLEPCPATSRRLVR